MTVQNGVGKMDPELALPNSRHPTTSLSYPFQKGNGISSASTSISHNAPRWSAYYITLRERPDRAKRFERWAKASDKPWSFLTKHVKPIVADRHAQGGDYGCWESHRSALQQCADAGEDYVVVFEDDAIPTRLAHNPAAWNLLYGQILDVMTTEPTWDVIGLGGIPLAWWHTARKRTSHVIQIPFLEAHSYIASKRFVNRLLMAEYTGTFDSELARRSTSDSYLITHELFEQDPACGSNLSLSLVIPFRRGYKKAVWAWARRVEYPCRNVVLATLAATVGISILPCVRTHLSSRPFIKHTSHALVVVLAMVYIINEYAQDCHSTRYRRTCTLLNQ